MKRINFKNKPNTDTPLSARNLNLLQDNIEEEIKALNESIIKVIGYFPSVSTTREYTLPSEYTDGLILSAKFHNANNVYVDLGYGTGDTYGMRLNIRGNKLVVNVGETWAVGKRFDVLIHKNISGISLQ